MDNGTHLILYRMASAPLKLGYNILSLSFILSFSTRFSSFQFVAEGHEFQRLECSSLNVAKRRPSWRQHRSLAGPNCKIPPKMWLKNSWNWLVIFISATVWQNFNIICMQWPETEVMWICWNFLRKSREITSSELIFGGF